MKTLSVVCEEKYNPVAIMVAQHYAIVSNYQINIRIFTPKQYLQEIGKDEVFNEGWLFSIGKNDCTNMYEHLIPNDISEDGLFKGVSGHIAIAYHEIDLISEAARKEIKKLVDGFDSLKKGENNTKEAIDLVKNTYGLVLSPSLALHFIKFQNTKTSIDLCMVQKAVDELLSSDAKEWLI